METRDVANWVVAVPVAAAIVVLLAAPGERRTTPATAGTRPQPPSQPP